MQTGTFIDERISSWGWGASDARYGRLPGMDVLKILAIIFVVLTHCYTDTFRAVRVPELWIEAAVPVFIIIGAFNYCRKAVKMKLASPRGWYTRRNLFSYFKRIGIPYIVFMIAQLIVLPLVGYAPVTEVLLNTVKGGMGAGGYYLVVFVQLFLLVPFFYFALKRRPFLTLLVAFAVRVAFGALCERVLMPLDPYVFEGVNKLLSVRRGEQAPLRTLLRVHRLRYDGVPPLREIHAAHRDGDAARRFRHLGSQVPFRRDRSVRGGSCVVVSAAGALVYRDHRHAAERICHEGRDFRAEDDGVHRGQHSAHPSFPADILLRGGSGQTSCLHRRTRGIVGRACGLHSLDSRGEESGASCKTAPAPCRIGMTHILSRPPRLSDVVRDREERANESFRKFLEISTSKRFTNPVALLYHSGAAKAESPVNSTILSG